MDRYIRLFKVFVGTAGLASTLSFCFANAALAKDLSGRLGVGFNNQFSNSTWSQPVPALSVKYSPGREIALAGVLGIDTRDPSSFTFGGKIFKNIFYENNLNFYSAIAMAYLKKQEKTGFELLGLMGCEFFIPGLDSLGFLFEFGASASNITGDFALKTVGFTFLQAGMHFYF